MDAGKRPFATGVMAPATGAVLTALAVLLAVGLLTFAGPCQGHGPATGCLVARRVLLGMDAVLATVSLVRVFELDEGERRGLSLCAALMGALIAATPGWLVALCADPAMRCRAQMRPFVLAVGVAVAVVGAVDLVRRLAAIGRASG